MPTTPTPAGENGLLFFKDVAKYFMDFLESDFHKKKLPRRAIKFRNSDNLLVGLNLQKYESFNKLVWSLVNKNFDKDVLSKVEKGVYQTKLPKNLLDLVKLQVEKISATQISKIIKNIAEDIERLGTLYETEYDIALNTAIDSARATIRAELVDPFIEKLDKPLQNLTLGDEGNIFLVEEELAEVLLRLVENKVSETLNLFIAKEKVNLEKELKSVFALTEVKSTLNSFFENLQVADLFAEIFEMSRNRSILEKQDFYLYFGDIAFGNAKYPIFYVPLSIARQDEVLSLEFDSQIYINKKALEYIVQENNVLSGKKGNLQTITERIIYLAQHTSDLEEVLSVILTEIINFFEAKGSVSFVEEKAQVAKGPTVRITNSCYIALFDKSDEALVNDYEDILKQLGEEGGLLSESFNKLLGDFLYNNPEPCNPEVEKEWDDTDITERLVVSSPIPLNAEQLQILSAIRKDSCRYLVIEGPPGTGKSHTITAIIFDAVLREQSVLVLSDKKEALDVVENNITQTINKVRSAENFQNPILRLGKTGNTYAKILAQGTYQDIKTHHHAVRKNHEMIVGNIEKSINSLREDLEAEVVASEDIDIQEVKELIALESSLNTEALVFDIDETLPFEEAPIEISEARSSLNLLKGAYDSEVRKELFEIIGVASEDIHTVEDYENVIRFLALASESIEKLKDIYKDKLDSIAIFDSFSKKEIEKLADFIKEYENLKAFLVGFFFEKKKVGEVDLRFRQTFRTPVATAHQEIQRLKDAYAVFDYIHSLGEEVNTKLSTELDYVAIVHRLLKEEGGTEYLKEFVKAGEETVYLRDFIQKYKNTAEKAGLNFEEFSSLFSNLVISSDELLFDKQLRYLSLRQKLTKEFSEIPDLNYALRKRNIEELVITQVAYLLDGRLIDFYEHNRTDAEALRAVIKNKQKFPKEQFRKLQKAFPCILAGIRDYAEYIPLEEEMFDLVIIDEASQVSIAQAFPALLRAKKVLILGDKKQFSNIKAAQARSDTNREYLNMLERSFKVNVSTEGTKLVKLEKFNIKTSILEFVEFISNYRTQLRKHFRGYKEIISYSNKYFYQDSLQVMKIRGKNIDDVIKFSYIEATPEDEVYPNSNKAEVEFIISELERMKDEGQEMSVGIITPHTNQQKLLVEMINKLPERDFYFEKLDLKIMTFDTCQGEERDIIYYPMVASEHSDRLWGIFIKDLNNVDVEEDGQIKAQRLNVGFSRGKECVHFVLSKPLDKFNGSIGDALRHYFNLLEEAKKEKGVEETDQNSGKEAEVLNWFYQTSFWNDNKERIEFVPQFEIGKYLRQLDPTYSHPAYKVDFLVSYQSEQGREHKIVIEYDGFKEHFKDADVINEFNYQNYYSDEDVYRQKVLESYGYKFLRINRFNVGENPIETLNQRLGRLVKEESGVNPLLHTIHETVEGLQNGKMKVCPKCKEVREDQDFRDSSLITGYGRFCRECKGKRIIERDNKSEPVLSDKVCPRCSSRMILRSGRLGKFYGCSRFPYCRGTRNT